MRNLYGAILNWAVEHSAPECPECADRLADEYDDKDMAPPPTPELEPGYVRAPAIQEHWRGVKALKCPECSYAEEAPAGTGEAW